MVINLVDYLSVYGYPAFVMITYVVTEFNETNQYTLVLKDNF